MNLVSLLNPILYIFFHFFNKSIITRDRMTLAITMSSMVVP